MAKTLPADLTCRPAGLVDLDGIVALNSQVHEPSVGDLARCLMVHHPNMGPADFWVVVDQGSRVLATQCLIPGTLRLGRAVLPYCELGLVGTVPEWRGQGLCGAMMAACHADLARRGALLTLIAGIPYFYRRFGYDYGIGLDAHHLLPLDRVPESSGEHTFRLATAADADLLCALDRDHGPELDLRDERNADIWRYKVLHSPATGYAAETWLIERANEVVGFVRVFRQGFGEGLILGDASDLTELAARDLLAQARQWAVARGKPHLRVDLPDHHALVRTAHALGAEHKSTYGWQARIADPAALLAALAPELEARAAGWSGVLEVDLYGQRVAVEFVDGVVTRVGSPEGEATLRFYLPPHLLGPLALGFRTWTQIREFYPDAYCDQGEPELIERLFPALRGWVQPVY